MAEQDTDQHTADVKKEETQSTNMDLSSDKYKQEKTDLAPKQRRSKDGDSAEEKKVPVTDKDSITFQADGSHGDFNRQMAGEEKPKPTDNKSGLLTGLSPENKEKDIQENKTSPAQETTEPTAPVVTGNLKGGNHSGERENETEGEADPENEHKDGVDGETPGTNTEAEKHNESGLETGSAHEEKEKETTETTDSGGTGSLKGGNHSGEEKETDREADPENEHKGGVDGETPDTKRTNTEAEKPKKIEEHYMWGETVEEDMDEPGIKVETIFPTTEETTEPAAPGATGNVGGSRTFLIVGIVVVVVGAVLVQLLLEPEAPPEKNDVRQIDLFLKQMEKMKTQFPKQRPELWNRSKIHLLRHLQTAQPTEPVSLILTAGARAEKTLHCLAQGLASAFSSALNASVLHIDGASKASQDSDQVKLDIDSKLQGAFEGDKPVAVIHRFEELPPGSTLIFYRYCDHENAAYKKTGLIFTVLLGEEEEIPANSRLSTVEEMVDDHLQKKFLSDDYPVSFDRMDLDKYGGLWSRISHLILPVAAEERMEHKGC